MITPYNLGLCIMIVGTPVLLGLLLWNYRIWRKWKLRRNLWWGE